MNIQSSEEFEIRCVDDKTVFAKISSFSFEPNKTTISNDSIREKIYSNTR